MTYTLFDNCHGYQVRIGVLLLARARRLFYKFSSWPVTEQLFGVAIELVACDPSLLTN